MCVLSPNLRPQLLDPQWQIPTTRLASDFIILSRMKQGKKNCAAFWLLALTQRWLSGHHRGCSFYGPDATVAVRSPQRLVYQGLLLWLDCGKWPWRNCGCQVTTIAVVASGGNSGVVGGNCCTIAEANQYGSKQGKWRLKWLLLLAADCLCFWLVFY